jgi:tetratricopeptide (TPR) repeat protein
MIETERNKRHGEGVNSQKQRNIVPILTCSGAGVFSMVKQALAWLFFCSCLPASAQSVPAHDRQQSVAAIMAAEYALQTNDLKTAAIEYTKAARYSDDVALSERASRLAMTAEMPELTRQALARWRQLAPDSSAMLSLALDLAMKQGEADNAFQYGRQLFSSSNPEHHKAFIDMLASEKSDGGVMARAVMRETANNTHLLPDQATLWIQLWVLSGRIEENSASELLAEKMGEKFPEDARTQLIAASVMREKGMHAEALAHVIRATKLAPQTKWVKQTILSELTLARAWTEADNYLLTKLQDEATLLMRGRFILANNQAELTEKFYQQVLQSEEIKSAKMQLLQAQLADNLGRWAEAEKIYQAIPQGAERDRAQLRLPVMLQKQNRIAEALANLHAYQKNPDADGEFVRDSYLVEANLFDDASVDGKAMKVFQRGLAIFENDPLLLYGRAMQHEKMSRANAALADLNLVLAQNPQNAEALNAYGYTLAKHKKAYPQAMVYLEKAIKLKPGSVEIMDSYGWVKLKLGQKQESLTWLEKAWLQAKGPEIAAHLGEAYWALGRKDEARKIWLQGQKINPQHSVWSLLKKNYSL